jgi:putative peptidoglycan lipid II flippase
MSRIRLMSGFLTVGFWTLVSRILGFVREILIAAYLGAGPVAESFYIAFSLPNMFRRFFGEGAFNMAFIPMFAKKLEGGENPGEFARDAFTGLGFILILFTALAQLVMPWLVLAMASGFLEDERFNLAALFGRIAFPYILFISLAALLSGVLNATGRFTAAAAAPALLNVIFIAGLVLAHRLGWNIGSTLAWSVPVAGMAQLALVWVAASRAGFRLIPRRPRLTPELKRLAIIAAPAALAGGVVQVNLLVGRQVASFFEGAIAWLNYADRLVQLPLGVVGVAIGVVLLPALSRQLRAGDSDGARSALSRAGEVSLLLTIPAATALIMVPMPLVETLFQRGAFNADDTAKTAIAVAVYGIGLPAFVLQKVLQPVYFARENTRTPFHFALVGMVVNLVLAVGLSYYLGFIAAAIGTTAAGWAMRFDRRFWSRFWRIVIASWAMGWVLKGSEVVIGAMFGSDAKYLGLTILILVGVLSYALIGRLLGAFRFSEFRSVMRRRVR